MEYPKIETSSADQVPNAVAREISVDNGFATGVHFVDRVSKRGQ